MRCSWLGTMKEKKRKEKVPSSYFPYASPIVDSVPVGPDSTGLFFFSTSSSSCTRFRSVSFSRRTDSSSDLCCEASSYRAMDVLLDSPRWVWDTEFRCG